MKLRNVVLSAVAVAILATAGALWWVYASRDALLKSAVEHYGPILTGVTVTVKGVRLEPAEGKGAILGLEIGNPAGFKSPRALTLAEMRLTIDFASVATDVIRLKEVVLEAPAITYERGRGSDNMSIIQKHLEAEVAKLAGPKNADAGAGKKFIIDHLYVRNAKASYSDTVTLPIPDLHLRDVGKKTNGATAGEVLKEVWGSLSRGATGLASRALDAVKDGANSVLDGARKLFK